MNDGPRAGPLPVPSLPMLICPHTAGSRLSTADKLCLTSLPVNCFPVPFKSSQWKVSLAKRCAYAKAIPGCSFKKLAYITVPQTRGLFAPACNTAVYRTDGTLHIFSGRSFSHVENDSYIGFCFVFCFFV